MHFGRVVHQLYNTINSIAALSFCERVCIGFTGPGKGKSNEQELGITILALKEERDATQTVAYLRSFPRPVGDSALRRLCS